jgi:chromosome segregation ATPase
MMDALDRLLELARAEGAGSAEGLAAFAGGLRERARLVLEERVGPLQDRIGELERETAWRRASMAGLEAEKAGLQADLTALQAELAGIKREMHALREAWDTTTASHEKLLAHHRDVIARAVERFGAAAELPPWRFATCRSLLRESAALFAAELR